MQRNKPRGHNSCERKQKWHNLISSPGCPSRSSLLIQVSSSPMIREGEKVGGRQWWTLGLNSIALRHDPFWQWCDIAFTAPGKHRLSSICPPYHSFPHASSANTCDVFFSQRTRKFVPCFPPTQQQWRHKANQKLLKRCYLLRSQSQGHFCPLDF